MHNFVFGHLEKEKKAGCFAITVLPMSCYYKYSAAFFSWWRGLSAVCDCGIP